MRVPKFSAAPTTIILSFGLVGNSGSSRAIVVDDISLTNQDGVNIIVDGGFESGNEEEPDEPDNPDIPVEPDIPEEPEETEVTFEVLKEKADVSKNAHSLYWNKGTTGYEAKTKVVPIEYGRSGTYSMYVGGTHGDGTELSLIYKGIIPTGTYILEFWTIAAPYTLGSWRFGGFNNFNNGNHTVGEVDADGWTKITRVVTLEEDTTDPGIIQIKNDGTLRAVVVDDIRLLDENGNDTGIIEDGGFELSTGASGTSGISFGEAKTLADFASYSDKSIWSMSVEGETVNAKMVPINASHKGKTSMYIGGTGTNGSAVYISCVFLYRK